MSRLAILGAGSWGTALAVVLAPKFDQVALWARDAALAAQIEYTRENDRYLPGFRIPGNVLCSPEIAGVLAGSEFVLSAVPSDHTRALFECVRPHVSSEMWFVSATKGIENASLMRMTEVIAHVLGPQFTPRVAALSGPTFAREVAAGEPAAVVIASQNASLSTQVQSAFSTPTFRLYTSEDVIGVEIAAALKNVIAIGAGVCKGLGLGSNSVAALVTRGLAELTRLAVALGGKPRTLAGLAGLGDLVLTATGDLSRNRFVGLQLGAGKPLPEILAAMTQVAEGVHTCRAARHLARRASVEMPIVEKMHEILYEQKPAAAAIRELMERPLTSE